MGTFQPSTTGATHDAAPRPYDRTIGRKIDDVLIELSEEPTPLRHAVLRSLKFWYERAIPAYHGEVAR